MHTPLLLIMQAHILRASRWQRALCLSYGETATIFRMKNQHPHQTHHFSPKSNTVYVFVLMLIGFFVAQFLSSLCLELRALLRGESMANFSTSFVLEDLEINWILLLQLLSACCVFVLPAWWFLVRRRQMSSFRLPVPSAEVSFLIVGILACAMVLNGVLMDWNQRIPLPHFFPSALRAWVEHKQLAYDNLVSRLFVSTTFWDYVVRLVVMALLPAVGEELIFRHILQREFVRMMRNAHVGIFLGAIVFSVFHLTWVGLLPRAALGVLFGYLYWLSSSLSTAILAHFLNNAFIVTLGYLQGLRLFSIPLNNSTSAESPSFYLVLFALLMLFFLFRLYRRRFQQTPSFPDAVLKGITASSATGWRSVYADPQLHRIQLLSDLLSHEGVQGVIVNKKDSAYQFGLYELHVRAADWETSKLITKRFDEAA